MAYECATCDKTFSTSQYLESHCKVKRHSMNECRLCDRIFKDECALDQVRFSRCIHLISIDAHDISLGSSIIDRRLHMRSVNSAIGCSGMKPP